jgi:putative ABC transport system permease protein
MIRHLWKLIWNRRKSNLFILLEVFVSFLVIFVVIVTGVKYLDNYGRPLGFSYKGVWAVYVGTPESAKELIDTKLDTADVRKRMDLMLQRLEELPEIAGASATIMAPYKGWNWTDGYHTQRASFVHYYDQVSDRFPQLMGLQLVRGRWFDKEDDGASFDPVLINRKFAEMAFGDEDPIGKKLGKAEGPDDLSTRIVGIFADYRMHGELSDPAPLILYRSDLTTPHQKFIPEHGFKYVPQHILVRIRPGTPESFEEKLISTMESQERDWSFEVKPLEILRHEYMRDKVTPLIIFSIMAAFLLLMSGSGLLGVLWMNVTRRTQEIGLRRAQGATAAAIYRQFLAEVLLIASIGIGQGCMVLLVIMPFLRFVASSIPGLNILPSLRVGVMASGIVISGLLVSGIAALCALYPAYLATRIQPAEALHYE